MSGLVNILLSSGDSIDADVQAWIDQVALDGGTAVSPTVQSALSDLVTSLKASPLSLWTRTKRFWIWFAGDLTTGRRNIKNPATFRTTLIGANVFTDGLGTKSDGSSCINSTVPSNEYAGVETDLTVVIYISDPANPAASGAAYGSRVNTGFQIHIMTPKVGAAIGQIARFEASANNFANVTMKGRYIETHDGTNRVVYHNGVKYSAAIAPTAPNISPPRLYLARNSSGINGGVTVSNHFQYNIAYALELDQVDDADAAELDTILGAFELAAGLP